MKQEMFYFIKTGDVLLHITGNVLFRKSGKGEKMKKIFALFLMTFIALLFTGCGENKPQRVSAAIVGGPIMNAPDYPLNSPTLERYLEEVCLSYGKISFVRADGNPQLFYQTTIPAPPIEGLRRRGKDYTPHA